MIKLGQVFVWLLGVPEIYIVVDIDFDGGFCTTYNLTQQRIEFETEADLLDPILYTELTYGN